MRKIALEIQLTDYEQFGTDKVMELIEHLECLKEELYKLIAISEKGAVAHNESLRREDNARAGTRIVKHNPVAYFLGFKIKVHSKGGKQVVKSHISDKAIQQNSYGNAKLL